MNIPCPAPLIQLYFQLPVYQMGRRDREMEAQGKRFGVEENPLREAGNAVDYSFPVERKEFLFVTSPFGMRQDTKDGTKRMHTGMDIRCNNGDAMLATEQGGKVVAVGNKSLTVE